MARKPGAYINSIFKTERKNQMKKLIIIFIGVMTITGLISLDFAMAKKENTGVETGQNRPKSSLSATPEEMNNMAELLEKMVYGIKSGNTTL